MQKLAGEYGINSSSYRNKKWAATTVMNHSYILKANGSLDIKERKMSVTYGYIRQRKVK